jgi:hypothetical protein
MYRHPALLIAPWMAIRQSKTGRTRHVVLTNEGISFFRRSPPAALAARSWLRKANGETWRASHQLRPIAQACHHAKIEPPVSFRALRQHLGKQLGHERRAAGRSGEEPGSRRHAHGRIALRALAPSYIADTIRTGASKFGFKPNPKIATLATKGAP